MHQPVDAVLDAEEEPEGGDVADLRPDHGADGIGLPQALPRVLLDLLHAEGDPLVLDVDVQDQRLDDVSRADHLGGVLHPLGPAHLGDVDQALDALLQFDERAVVGEVDHLAGDLLVDVVALGDVEPRVLGDLLETQGHPLGLGIEFQDLYLNFVAHAEHLGGVVDPAPRHVGDVQEAVDSAEIHEAAVLSDVLDDPVDDLAHLEVLEGLLLQLLALRLEQGPTGQHDVAALLVELDHLELERLADVSLQVPNGAEIHLGAGEEGLDADVHREAALDPVGDHALDQLTALRGFFDLVPDLQLLRLVLGELHQAVLILELVYVDGNALALLGLHAAINTDELV